jgi:hypothetical protein
MGSDGRLRPLTSLDGRRRASEPIVARPEAPLREIAAEAGISVGTAHDVRQRMQRGMILPASESAGQAQPTVRAHVLHATANRGTS